MDGWLVEINVHSSASQASKSFMIRCLLEGESRFLVTGLNVGSYPKSSVFAMQNIKERLSYQSGPRTDIGYLSQADIGQSAQSPNRPGN
jgi:hypothetical protein